MSSQPSVDFRAGCASRWRSASRLTATVGVEVKGNSISVIRSSWDCCKISSIAALALVAFPEVLLSGQCSESTGNRDGDSALQGSVSHLGEGTGSGCQHSVVRLRGGKAIGSRIRQMVSQYSDDRVGSAPISSYRENLMSAVISAELTAARIFVNKPTSGAAENIGSKLRAESMRSVSTF
jgi:hypothetical protein